MLEAHGGKIWAENNSDGKEKGGGGAIFVFTLPLSNNYQK